MNSGERELGPPAEPNPTPQTQPQWVEQWLQNQAQDIQLRSEQLALSKQQQQHAHEYANASLEAQLTDRREERTTHSGLVRHFCRFILVALFLILAFFGTLFLTGHEQAALELAKILIYGGVGAAGGYGIGRGKKQPSAPTGE